MRIAAGDTAWDVEEARGYWPRFRGLMLRAKLEDGHGLLIEPCSSIHMMFMRFSLDVVFYDRDHRVTRVGRHVRPWIGMAWGGRGARGVLELPSNSASSVRPGDLLEWDLPDGTSRGAP